MARLRDIFRQLVTVDLRALAAFRVAIALCVLADLAIRSADIHAFYSDAGILTRAERVRAFGWGWAYSVYDLVGSTPAIGAGFAVVAVAAVALLVGYHTRVATVICWLSALGLMIRSPLIVTGGDLLLVSLLLWSALLPLGARWSVDAARAAPRDMPAAIANTATFALVGQVVSMMLFTGFAKLGSKTWRAGDAVYYSLHAFQTTSIGEALHAVPWLLTPLTYAVLAFEVAGPFVLIAPRFNWQLRTAYALALAAMNASFFACLRIGIFSWVAIAGCLVLLPTPVWDAAARRWGARLSPLAERATRLARRLPPGGAIRLGLARPIAVVAAVLFAGSIAINLSAASRVPLPAPVSRAMTVVGLHQRGWSMFAPPPKDRGWFAFPGKLADGRMVDVYEGGAPLSYARPDLISDDFPNYRWRKLLAVIRRRGAGFRPYVSRYLCREWNAHHTGDDRLVELELVYMKQKTLLDFAVAPVERVSMVKTTCQ